MLQKRITRKPGTWQQNELCAETSEQSAVYNTDWVETEISAQITEGWLDFT